MQIASLMEQSAEPNRGYVQGKRCDEFDLYVGHTPEICFASYGSGGQLQETPFETRRLRWEKKRRVEKGSHES